MDNVMLQHDGAGNQPREVAFPCAFCSPWSNTVVLFFARKRLNSRAMYRSVQRGLYIVYNAGVYIVCLDYAFTKLITATSRLRCGTSL